MTTDNDNCMNCLYSEFSETNILISDTINKYRNNQNNQYEIDYATCGHENSPFFEHMVNSEICCRLFLDSNKFFKQKDRKSKLDNLNNGII